MNKIDTASSASRQHYIDTGGYLNEEGNVMTNEQALNAARDLTAENDHQGTVLMIAEHFGYTRIAICVRGVIMIQEVRGHLPEPLSAFMRDLRQEMYDAIEAEHGRDMRCAVYRCL